MTAALGLTAAVLTTGCWVPQLLRSYRTRSTIDLSWGYLLVLGAGVGLWLAYGLLEHDAPLVVANVATAVAMATLGGIKLVFDRRERSNEPPIIDM